MKNYIYFWKTTDKYGFMSQWYTSTFNDTDVKGFTLCFTCAEQYMMYKKALLFGDFDVAKKIYNSAKPNEMKALGRQVKNFNAEIWDKNKLDIVIQGNYLKFSQDSLLRKKLLDTGTDILAEASPFDKVWGIGLDEKTANRGNGLDWQGENLLGQALMTVRNRLREEMQNNVL